MGFHIPDERTVYEQIQDLDELPVSWGRPSDASLSKFRQEQDNENTS